VAKKKIGIGIIGTGGIAVSTHMPGFSKLKDECEIVAVADVDEKAVRAAAEKFEVPNVYTDYKKLIANPAVDAVSICTPNYLHVDPAVAAFKAGKHVLCEKPLARNADEGRRMVKAARDAGKILQVALQWRFTSHAQYLKRFIEAGKLGPVYYARAQALRRRGIPSWGVFTDKEKQGGGPLIDIGVHILDLTLFLMGYPKAVSTLGKTFVKFGDKPNVVGLFGKWDYKNFTVEDFAVGYIRFENGAVVVLESSFCANIKNDVFATEILGEKAGVRLQPMDEPPLEVYTEADGALVDQRPVFLPKVNPYDAETAAFVEAIRKNKPSPVPGEQGLMLNAIFDALYKSSETGKEEPVDLRV